MNIFSRLFGKRTSSKEMAKKRLQDVLIYDRSGIPPELLQVMKNDIVTVVSKHVWVDREGIQMKLSYQQGLTRLVADIPIAGTRSRPAPARTRTR